MQEIIEIISKEINSVTSKVKAAVELLDGGATVPFIARYRKEATGGLDDIQLRTIQTRLQYLRELAQRREAIINSIQEQGKLTPELQASIEAATTKQELEDIYLPYKPKRRTKGQIAREYGLEPLADAIVADPTQALEPQAQAYVNTQADASTTGFDTVEAVLNGVRDILSERWAEMPTLVQYLRRWLWQEGALSSQLVQNKSENDAEVAKFRDYFEYDEPIANVPSHRALAVLRGRQLDILQVKINLPETEIAPAGSTKGKALGLAESKIAQHINWQHQNRAADDFIQKCVVWTWKVKLSLSIERDLIAQLRDNAEKTAIDVFANNLRDVLMAAPAGQKVVMGLDPGIRTGVKVVVIDHTGKLLQTGTVYPHEPRKDWQGSIRTLSQLCRQYKVQLIAIGNGTASRETDKLAADVIKQLGNSADIQKVVISEAGASVYSASEQASQELPDIDVSLRGAASIARRLQDPLAELVKIDPKSIGVGQYQHDVNQTELARSLDAVVEDCVNHVGVDVNTASSPLLSRVSGLNHTVAKAIVHWREHNGAFTNRQQLLKVSGFGAKTFEHSIGFLRIRGGDNPLDITGVHPETYPIVEHIMAHVGTPIDALMGNKDQLKQLKPAQFTNDTFGIVTVQDILQELEKPGRDPRPEFTVARFNEGVETITDLQTGMILEGTISNVAAFGAFVDLGVHQDGLIHVSQLANKFVEDAREIVKTGQIVQVKVLEVDIARKRISLSMKLDTPTNKRPEPNGKSKPRKQSGKTTHTPATTAMASAFEKLKGLR